VKAISNGTITGVEVDELGGDGALGLIVASFSWAEDNALPEMVQTEHIEQAFFPQWSGPQ